MKTIKERAFKYANHCKGGDYVADDEYECFVYAAEGQRRIDIEVACAEFEDCITQIGLDYHLSDEYMEDKCRKFREELENKLYGEEIL